MKHQVFTIVISNLGINFEIYITNISSSAVFGCKSKDVKVISKKEVITESSIHGKWIVTKSSVLPFEHILYCKKLGLSSVFEFKSDRTIHVYETLNGSICTKQQTFNVRGEKLQIIEWDMIFWN